MYAEQGLRFMGKTRQIETHGSPMTKLSPALIEGTRPNEPTSAAAASLEHNLNWWHSETGNVGAYDMMSPYKLGATMTSKILGNIVESYRSNHDKTHCGSRNNLKQINMKVFTLKAILYAPINCAIDQLLLDVNTIEFPLDTRQPWHSTYSLAEQTIRDRQNVRFVDYGN